MKTVSTIRKALMTVPGALLSYLLQVCLFERVTLWGIAGSVLWAYLAVMIVSCGKLSAFIASCLIGLCTEAMLKGVPALNAVCYPLFTVLWSMVFADLSEETIERRIAFHSKMRKTDLPAPLRMLLCTVALEGSYLIIRLFYIYLNGAPLAMNHFLKLFGSLFLTVLVLIPVAPLMRWALGMYRKPRSRPITL